MNYRKYIFLFALLFSISYGIAQRKEIGNLVIDGVPDIPSQIAQKMNQYQSVRSALFLDWNPSGSGMLIATRFGETSQIHFVEHLGGARQQLTFFKEPVSSALYCPDPEQKGFLFSMDVGGSEFYQLFYLDVESGKVTLMTDGKSRNMGPVWSKDGKRIAFSSTLRNGRDVDIRLMSLTKPGESEVMVTEGGNWGAIEFSPDDTRLLLEKYVSINDSYLYVLDIASKQLTQLNIQPGKNISYGFALWGRDGKSIYYTSDEEGEFQKLFLYEIATGQKKIISTNNLWDVSTFALTKDGTKLAYIVSESGIAKLRLLDLQKSEEKAFPDLPLGVISTPLFNKDGSELAMTINAPNIPSDVYSMKVATGEIVRWTFSELGGLRQTNFIVPELIEYPTFDELNGKPRMIPAFYYKPKNAKGKVPVAISIHGGPEAQELPTFNPLYQYMLHELGIAILAPNVRGSAGYGKVYLTLDNGYKREDSVKDIGCLLDWIKTRDELDSKRVAVMGGSYGGYMVLASMFHYNDRINAGLDVVGISNFVTFLEHTQEYRRDLRRVEYGDERDPQMREFLLKIAPTTNAHRITCPLFVVQGLNDPRVPASESEQIVNTVREKGIKVWYLLAKDEGHGFRKKSNRDLYLNATIFFWETFLIEK